ncbi:MAG: hypothetical protein HY069_05065 [Chlamydiia bacterium]|nr:hypothetical protein [Chlamydiia bacterium]
MSSSRIGGTPPADPNRMQQSTDKAAPGQHKKIGKIEKIEEASEIDENAKRKQKFLEAMEGPAPQKKEETAAPTPFQSEFYYSNKPASKEDQAIDELGTAAVPSPAYSLPPPTLPKEKGKKEDEEDDLPKSGRFWEEIDEPPDRPLPTREFQETTQFQKTWDKTEVPPSKKESPSTQQTPLEKPFQPTTAPKKEGLAGSKKVASKSETPTEMPSSPAEMTPKKKGGDFSAWKEQTEPSSPKSRPLYEREKGPQPQEEIPSSLFAAPSPPLQKEETPLSARRREEEPFAPIEKVKKREEPPLPPIEKEKEKPKEKKKWAEIEAHHLPPLPQTAIPSAQAALQQAMAFLNPDTFALFYQMVGTIFVMTWTRGMTKTDILLNSPAFSKSKFYGSTITIEKYATAPDSLNIVLSGTDEAVTAFNQNLPGLMNAFQKGNFKFRIGRLEARYRGKERS